MKKAYKAKIDANGKLKIFGLADFDLFLKRISNSDVIITIEKPEEGATKYQIAYFYAVVCESFKNIFYDQYGERASKEMIKETLLKWYPYGRDDEGNIKELTELSSKELTDFIDHSKMIANAEFDVFIQ
jgi:hypothetical protein